MLSQVAYLKIVMKDSPIGPRLTIQGYEDDGTPVKERYAKGAIKRLLKRLGAYGNS